MFTGDMSWVDSPATLLAAGVITGGIGFVFWVLNAVARGKWVPAATVDRLQRIMDERLQESRDETKTWRDAHSVSEEARQTRDQQVDQLVVLGETTVALLKALPDGRTPQP